MGDTLDGTSCALAVRWHDCRVGDRLRHIVTQVSLGRLIVLWHLAPSTPVPSDLVAGYAGGAIIGVIEWWLENKMPLSPKILARYTLELIVNGLYRTIGLDSPSLPEHQA